MYQNFNVNGITAINSNKSILIETSKFIDNTAQSNISIEIYERYNKVYLDFYFIIDGKNLIINLLDWPVVNTDYILGVKGITSITGEELSSNIKTRIKFISEVKSKVQILSPVMFEKVPDLNIKLEEILVDENDKNAVGKFYVEIAKDNIFKNLTNKFLTDKTENNILLNDKGQYYLRARIQKDDENYGCWSEIVSFVYKEVLNEDKPVDNPGDYVDNPGDYIDTDFGDDDNPSCDFEDDLILIEYPEQGESI